MHTYIYTIFNQLAVGAYYTFMGFIGEARNSIYQNEDNFIGGLHIDIHGHGHKLQRLELGYDLSKYIFSKYL